jgi:hypothetical protein
MKYIQGATPTEQLPCIDTYSIGQMQPSSTYPIMLALSELTDIDPFVCINGLLLIHLVYIKLIHILNLGGEVVIC